MDRVHRLSLWIESMDLVNGEDGEGQKIGLQSFYGLSLRSESMDCVYVQGHLDPVRVKQAMVKLDVDPTPPFFGLGGFQIIILMSFESKIFFFRPYSAVHRPKCRI